MATDTAYDQWMRALGFAQADANRQAQSATGRIDRRVGFEAPVIDEGERRNVRGVGQQMENRGLTRSGENLRRQAETRYDSGVDRGRLYLGAAESKGSINESLASELARIRMQESEQANQLAYRQAAKGY